jgi:ABC-type sugar transport system permease subunit
MAFAGLSNFRHLLRDRTYLRAQRNTFVFVLLSNALVLVLAKGLPLSLLKDFRGNWVVRLPILPPWVAPMAIAGVLTVVIFAFMLVMQEFVYGLTFITAASRFTVSVGVPTFLVRGDVYFWGSLMGACFIASVPIAILYNLFVDRFIAGFTVGAIK